MGKVKCPYCNKACKSKAGLQQHLNSNKLCKATRLDFLRIEQGGQAEWQGNTDGTGGSEAHDEDHNSDLEDAMVFEVEIPEKVVHQVQDILDEDFAARQQILREAQNTAKLEKAMLEERQAMLLEEAEEFDVPDVSFDPFVQGSSDEEDNAGAPGEQINGQEDELNGQEDEDTTTAPSQESNKQFKKYVRDAYQNFAQLTTTEKTAIRLMHTLHKKKATLDTYEAVMEWHLRDCGKLNPHQLLGKSKHFISRPKLMEKLKMRYNMGKKFANGKTIVLPHTKSKVDVWWHHARDCVQSLLTDPRWKDNDWLYFDDDPFAPPPDNLQYVKDINTGEAYLETYRKLITKPDRQILVGLPLYIDGAVTGQFNKLQVTALKMSLGILNRRARDKEYGWRSLGFVTNYSKEDSRGKKILVESGHVAASEMYLDMSEEEGENAAVEDDADKSADYHEILSVLLDSLKELIEEGMMVDIFYNGKLHRNCELVFFVPFVKCNGDEGDKLCGSYRSRGVNVKQLCRYCQCPNAETDNEGGMWPYKTEPMLKKLFENGNVEKLKDLSQIALKNAFHGLQFGLHNNRGIHGACPWELLHAILLGIFKYARDCFFAQMGPTSVTAEEINSLAKMIGALFSCQSDRTMPRTKFAKGILKGKLMAKEYTGVLLVMAAILRSQAGVDLLCRARKKNFHKSWQRQDWLLLVETLLQWEAYLSQDRMQKKHVHRLKKKHRFLMFLIKKVGNRTKGMGFKVMKFHAIIHLAYDILMFGVPMVVDTGSNESHHKTTKVAAKLTQKDIKTFEKQTSDRLDEFHLLDLAMEEMNGRPLWEYFSGFEHPDTVKKEKGIQTGGMMFEVFWNDKINATAFEIQTRMANKNKVFIEAGLVDFLYDLQEELSDTVTKLQVYSEHSRHGQMFRAHPNYRGKGHWRDWVMIQWEEGDTPAEIWCYVDLTEIPEGTEITLDSGMIVEHGVFAVVKCTTWVEDEEEITRSDLFTPLAKAVNPPNADNTFTRLYTLVNVEAFKDPVVVIPNIGHEDKNQYFMVAPRFQWADDFAAWLEMPHQHDKMEMHEEEEESDEEEELTEEEPLVKKEESSDDEEEEDSEDDQDNADEADDADDAEKEESDG